MRSNNVTDVKGDINKNTNFFYIGVHDPEITIGHHKEPVEQTNRRGCWTQSTDSQTLKLPYDRTTHVSDCDQTGWPSRKLLYGPTTSVTNNSDRMSE